MIGGNNQMNAQIKTGGSSDSNGTNNDGGSKSDVMLKKGPWTATEDAMLTEYVRTHGKRNWNAVQKNTGLARCGKSCRLRWTNHLRPNLKKGAFSPEEERTIIELHAKMGNKWARMATQLPGRTDNEIKNYWNTRVKRRQRQGLPLYPPDIQPLYSQHHHRYSQPPPPPTSASPTTASASACFSFQTPIMSLHTSTIPASLHPLRPPPQDFFYNPYSAATTPLPLNSPSGSTLPPPPPPPISPLPSPHSQPPFPTLPLFDYPAATADYEFFHSNKRFKHDGSQSNNSSSSFMLPFSHVQSYSNRVTLDLDFDSGSFFPLKTEQDDGLLDDMLQEAQALAAGGNGGGNKEMPKEMNGASATQHDQEEEEEEEEDYSRLINDDGPTTSMGMAVNEWCNDTGGSSDRQPSVATDNVNHLALDHMHQIASLFPVDHSSPDSSVRSWHNL
ncbi:hypothetical protein V6N13_009713 [Hibiscus sabdariffa]